MDAISASTGAILWSYTPQAPQQSGDLALQAVANGTVYIRDGSANHQIEALNATSGALLWTYETPENIQNAAYAGGMIYVGSGDGNVYAVNTATHTTKWVRYGLGVPFVAFANGTVYELALTGLGQQPGELEALKPFNGHLIWTRGVSDSYLAPMIVGGGYVFVTDGNQLEAFNLANAGIEQWYDYGQNPRELQDGRRERDHLLRRSVQQSGRLQRNHRPVALDAEPAWRHQDRADRRQRLPMGRDDTVRPRPAPLLLLRDRAGRGAAPGPNTRRETRGRENRNTRLPLTHTDIGIY